ncbi:MAG TPA: PAS domain S-box protein [Chthoniobacterales bacterium]
MSLRLKSLLVFAATVTLLFAIVLAFARIVIERQFDDVEIADVTRQTSQFAAELAEDLAPLIVDARALAGRSAVRDLAEGSPSAPPSPALAPQTLVDLRLSFVALYRPSGDLVFVERTLPNLSAGEIGTALAAQPLVPATKDGEPPAGLMTIAERLFHVTAVPVLSADGSAAGTLVAGRIISSAAPRLVNEFSGYNIRFLIPGGGNRLSEPPPPSSVRVVDSGEVAALFPLRDLRGDWIATAELAGDRHLHFQAARTIRIFVIGLASAAGILLFVVWYLLDANVILPVRQLATRLVAARRNDQLPTNLGLRGRDELADLARTIEDLARTVLRAEAKYRAIVEDQTEFILRYLPNGRITFANEALCRYFNVRRESLIGLDAHRLVANEDIRRVTSAIDTLSVDNPVVTLNHRVLPLPDHSSSEGVSWLRRTDRGIFSETGQLREIQCVARDITLTHLTHQRLEASEIRYRRLFETAADGIVIIRQADHLITDVNPAFCRLLNLSRLFLLNRPLGALAPFRTSRVRRAFERILAPDSTRREAEVSIRNEDDTRHYFEVTARVYETGDDDVIQLNFRDISQRKHASDELRQLSGHLLRSQDEERRRIARELHDSTAQTLTAIQMALTQLTGLGPETRLSASSAEALLADIRSLTDTSLREIRTISYLLHPPLLDEVGLLFALRWYVDGFISRTEIVVRLDAPETLERQPAEVETTIFRVVQEGLSNIHRHSGSRRAWIRLAVEQGALALTIRDEGRGIPDGPNHDDHPVPGVGIAGMRERLRQFKGSLTIESNGDGTTIHATLPLDSDVLPDD